MQEFNEDLLQEYLDGTLDAAARRAVEAHLASSPAARAQLAELKALFRDLSRLQELPLALDLSALIVAEIEREAAVPFSLPRWLWGVLGIQVTVALLLLGSGWAFYINLWDNSRHLAAEWIASIRPPTLAFVRELWADVTAVWQQTTLPVPTLELPVSQWTLLIALALIAWLAGNRLLFTPE